MRTTSAAVLALCTLSTAQQIPFLDEAKSWFNRATQAASSYGSAASSAIPNPATAAASSIAGGQVTKLTVQNYDSVLSPGAATSSPGIEEWMIYVTGGNKSCYGRCERAEAEWNKSVPLLTATRGAPNLALLDCEAQPQLCYAWVANPPSLVHVRRPQPGADQSAPASEVRYINFNRTTVTSNEIAALHTKEEYKKTEPYEGMLHPFDGPLAKVGGNIAFGYLVWAFNLVPSWAFMIGVSMLSRTIMSNRMGRTPPRTAQQGGAQGGAPAPAAAT